VSLLLITLAVAVISAMLLFRIYHMGLMFVLSSFNWKVEDLKSYVITPNVKMWNQVFETLLVIAVLYKVVFT
jgi:hypothetical protein